MKITPMAQGGAPGESLTSTNVGRTADPMKMERARAIARGEKVESSPEQTGDSQADRVRKNVRSIIMRTQQSTDRDVDIVPTEDVNAQNATTEIPAPEAQSSKAVSNEQPVVEATQPLSPQLAAIAKAKRALQLERAEFEKQKAETDTLKGAAGIQDRLKSDTLSVLQEAGVLDSPEFYNSLTERILGNQNAYNPEIAALKAEVKALKEGVDQSFKSQETRAEESALTEMLYEAEALAKEGDAFEMIRERGQAAYDRVLRKIYNNYKKTGRVLDVTEAMNSVEGELLEEALKFARLGKVQGKLAPTPTQPVQPGQKQLRTLTASGTSTAPLTARQRALAAFSGTLKR
jgi:hypothetical protein